MWHAAKNHVQLPSHELTLPRSGCALTDGGCDGRYPGTVDDDAKAASVFSWKLFVIRPAWEHLPA